MSDAAPAATTESTPGSPPVPPASPPASTPAESAQEAPATESTHQEPAAPETGVPVLPTTGAEPQGPEDALGPGPKRGDYRGRQPEGAVHMTGEVIPEDERVEGGPITRHVVQNHHTHNIGDVPGEKGGVTTKRDDVAEMTPAQ